MAAPAFIITTRFRAVAATLLTALFLALSIRHVLFLATARPLRWTLVEMNFLPAWAGVAINIVLYICVILMANEFAMTTMRREEKAILLPYGITILLRPVGALIPMTLPAVRFADTCLDLTAFLASFAMLLSFHHAPEPPPPDEHS